MKNIRKVFGREATLQRLQDAHYMPNLWVFLRCYHLIPVDKSVNEKEQLEKGLEEEGE
jgi:hypothetical protein